MKYLVIFSLISLGFISHKALEEVYDYKWYQGFNSSLCEKQYAKDASDPTIDTPLTKRFNCTYKYMGLYAKLRYILMRPHWFDDTGERWYY